MCNKEVQFFVVFQQNKKISGVTYNWQFYKYYLLEVGEGEC